jgi:flagella basal body P-ring formation protein FlgA
VAVCACVWLSVTPVATQPSIEDARVRAAVVAAIHERLGTTVRVDLEAFTARMALDAPDALTATPDPMGRTGRPVRFVIATAAGPRGHARRVGEATAIVQVWGPHVRARRPLDAGRTLTLDDIELGDGPIDGAPLRGLPSADDVIGSRVLRAVAAGDPIVAGVVAGVPVVRAGDRVRATVRGLGVEVALVAVAEQSGIPDQIIRVINPDSRRVVRARVVAKGEVEVLRDR